MHALGLIDYILLDPVGEFRHFGVNTRSVVLTATDTPADETGQEPAATVLAH